MVSSHTRYLVILGLFGLSTCTCVSEGPRPAETQPQCLCEDIQESPSPPAQTPRTKGGSLRIRVSEDPPSLMPLIDPLPVVKAIVEHDVLETLVRVSMDGKQATPGLAVNWSIDENYTLYTFKLDPRAEWHDGEKLTAEDVETTMAKILDPDGEVSIKRKFSSIKEVTLIDEYTISIELDRPRPGFLRDIAAVTILPAHLIDHSSLARHSAIRKPIGSGPFKFVKWVPGEYIVLERNPAWRGTPPLLDRIEYWIIQDNRVALDLFRRGELDIVPELPGYTEMEPGARRVVYDRGRVDAWVYNTERPMFSVPGTRRAIGALIDSDAIRCAIFKCRSDLIRDPWGILPVASRRFDPAAARKELSEVGWQDRDGDGVRERGGIDLAFHLTISDNDRDVGRVAAVIQDDLATSGVKMSLTTVDFSTYLGRLQSKNFDVAQVSVPVDANPDPWPLFHSEAVANGQNYGAFEDPGMDALIDGLNAEVSDETKEKIIRDIATDLDLLSPMTFIQRRLSVALVAPYVQGFNIEGGSIDETALWRSATKRKAEQ